MDELTPLRRLEADTPAPTEAALTLAFTALAERMDAAERDALQSIRSTAPAQRSQANRGRRAPLWTTAVVAAGLAVVAVLAVQHGTAPSGGAPGAPAAAASSASATEAAPTAAASATPSAAPSAKPDYEYDLTDPHDVSRANAELACYRSHGVKIVGLTAPDAHGISFIEYGGAHDDQRSITLGLKYQALCTAVGDSAR